MIPDLGKDFPCRSFFYARTEIFFTTCYRTVYSLVLLDRVYQDNIIWIKSVFREHSLGENMSKLVASCIFYGDWATCEVSLLSLFQDFQKKRRFRSTISDPFSSLSSYLFYWCFLHNGKCSVYKILSVVFSVCSVWFYSFLCCFQAKKEKKIWFFDFFCSFGYNILLHMKIILQHSVFIFYSI